MCRAIGHIGTSGILKEPLAKQAALMYNLIRKGLSDAISDSPQ